MSQNLPDGFKMTELGPLPEGAAGGKRFPTPRRALILLGGDG